MNPSSNPPTILQGVQSLTLCIQDSLRRRPEEKGAPSPTKRPANAESEVCVRVCVCVRRGRCLCNRKHVRTFWSQLRRRRRCAASGSPVLSPAADSPSHSAQAEEERQEWEREQQRGGRPDRGRSQRSVSRERWVETMVVADSKLIEYHGSENVESYIFTIMNMVSSLGRSEVFCSLLFTPKIFPLLLRCAGGWDLPRRQHWERHPRHPGPSHSAAGGRGTTVAHAFRRSAVCALSRRKLLLSS